MSASTSKSISSTFSSQRLTSWSGLVSPATVGVDRFGKMHCLPSVDRIPSYVQKLSGFLGVTR
jgi:hypothetical protein